MAASELHMCIRCHGCQGVWTNTRHCCGIVCIHREACEVCRASPRHCHPTVCCRTAQWMELRRLFSRSAFGSYPLCPTASRMGCPKMALVMRLWAADPSGSSPYAGLMAGELGRSHTQRRCLPGLRSVDRHLQLLLGLASVSGRFVKGCVSGFGAAPSVAGASVHRQVYVYQSTTASAPAVLMVVCQRARFWFGSHDSTGHSSAGCELCGHIPHSTRCEAHSTKSLTAGHHCAAINTTQPSQLCLRAAAMCLN